MINSHLSINLRHKKKTYKASFKNTHNIEPNFEELIGNCLRFYLFIFRARGREGGREGEKHQCVVASHTPPTGDLAHNPGMCPDRESNRWPSGLQEDANPLNHTSQGRFHTSFSAQLQT